VTTLLFHAMTNHPAQRSERVAHQLGLPEQARSRLGM
jgi:hypothetical protein